MDRFLDLARLAGSFLIFRATGYMTPTAKRQFRRIRSTRTAQAERLQAMLNAEHWDRYGWKVEAHELISKQTRPND